jgi:aminoglycoside N3'-acetyltransferase
MLRRLAFRYIGRDNLRALRQSLGLAGGVAADVWRHRRQRPVPVAEIRAGLVELGIAAGDVLLVHSAVGTLARAASAAAASRDSLGYGSDILRMLLELLGPDGTLMMPTAPAITGYDMATRGEVFDPAATPAGTGLLPNLLLAMPGAVRSPVPWQNAAAVGRHAAMLMADHLRSAPYAMGPGSPWHKLNELGAKVALIAVDHDRSSTVHVVENSRPLDYPRPVFFDKPHQFRYRAADGSIGTVGSLLHAVRWQDGDIVRFARHVGERHGIYRRAAIGRTAIIGFRAKDQYDAFLAEMRRDVSMFDAAFRQS